MAASISAAFCTSRTAAVSAGDVLEGAVADACGATFELAGAGAGASLTATSNDRGATRLELSSGASGSKRDVSYELMHPPVLRRPVSRSEMKCRRRMSHLLPSLWQRWNTRIVPEILGLPACCFRR